MSADGRTQEAAEGTGPPRPTPAMAIPAGGEQPAASSPLASSTLDRRDRSLKALLALHAEPLSSGPQTQDFASVARTLEATLSASYSKKTAVQEEILKSETLPVTKDPSAILLRALKPALSQPPTPAVPHAVGAATEPNVPDRKHAASVAPTPSVERAAHSGIISHSADAALMQAHLPAVEALSPPVTRKRGALNTSVESSDFPHIANQIKLAAASPPKGPTLNIAQSPVVPPRIVEEPRKDEQSPPTPSLSDPVSPPSSVFQIELVKEEVTLAAPTGDTARIQSVPPKMPPLSLNGSPLSGSLSSPHFERRTSQATPVASSAPSEPSALRTATESFSPLPGSVLASRDNDGAAVAPSSPRKRTGLPPLAIPARPEMSATDGVRMTPRGTASQTPRTASTPRGSQARPDKMETPRGSLRPPEQETPRSLSTPRGRDGLTTPRGTRRDTNASEGTGRVTPRGGLTTPRGSPVPSLGALPPHRVEEKEKAAAAVEGARIEKTSSASADNSAKPERLAAAAAHGEEGGKMERVASSERVDKDRPMPAHVERDGKKEASASPSPARPVPTALAIPRLSSSPAQASSLEKRLAMSYTELPSAPLAQSSPKQRHGQSYTTLPDYAPAVEAARANVSEPLVGTPPVASALAMPVLDKKEPEGDEYRKQKVPSFLPPLSAVPLHTISDSPAPPPLKARQTPRSQSDEPLPALPQKLDLAALVVPKKPGSAPPPPESDEEIIAPRPIRSLHTPRGVAKQEEPAPPAPEPQRAIVTTTPVLERHAATVPPPVSAPSSPPEAGSGKEGDAAAAAKSDNPGSDSEVVVAPPPRAVLRRIESAKSSSSVLEELKKADDSENFTVIAPKPRNKPMVRANTINLPPAGDAVPPTPEPRRVTEKHSQSLTTLPPVAGAALSEERKRLGASFTELPAFPHTGEHTADLSASFSAPPVGAPAHVEPATPKVPPAATSPRAPPSHSTQVPHTPQVGQPPSAMVRRPSQFMSGGNAQQTDNRDLDLDDILDKMKDPRMGLDIRDRTKGLRTIKRSIIGSNFVDWLIENGFTVTGSRLEAVAIGTALLNTDRVQSAKSKKKKKPFKDTQKLYVIPEDEEELKKIKKAKKAQDQAVAGHVFTRQHVTYVLCMVCNHAIWGIGKNCYSCSVCNGAVHAKCLDTVSAACGGPPRAAPDSPRPRLQDLIDTASQTPWDLSTSGNNLPSPDGSSSTDQATPKPPAAPPATPAGPVVPPLATGAVEPATPAGPASSERSGSTIRHPSPPVSPPGDKATAAEDTGPKEVRRRPSRVARTDSQDKELVAAAAAAAATGTLSESPTPAGAISSPPSEARRLSRKDSRTRMAVEPKSAVIERRPTPQLSNDPFAGAAPAVPTTAPITVVPEPGVTASTLTTTAPVPVSIMPLRLPAEGAEAPPSGLLTPVSSGRDQKRLLTPAQGPHARNSRVLHLRKLSMSLSATPPRETRTLRDSSARHSGLYPITDVSPRFEDTREFLALVAACKSGDQAALQRVLVNPQAVKALRQNVSAVEKSNPLHLACLAGHAEVVELLLQKDAELVSIRTGQGLTPLHIAAQRGSVAVVKVLLDNKSDINARDYSNGQTALHMAAERGHTFVVKLLLDRDANPAITNTKGKTALDKAASKGHTAVTQLLEGKSQRTSRLERYQELQELKFLGLDAHSMDWFLRKIPIVHDMFDILVSDFNLCDGDNDGNITLEELKRYFQSGKEAEMKEEDEEFQELFMGLEKDKTEIDYKEFVWLMYLWCQMDKVDNLALIKEDIYTLRKGFRLLEKTFKYGDKDGSATLYRGQLAETLSEINGIYPPLEWEEITNRLANADHPVSLEGLDEIDFKRFMDVMQAWRIPEVLIIKVGLATNKADGADLSSTPPTGSPISDSEKKTFAVLETISFSSLRRALRREFKLSDVAVNVLLPSKSGTLESRLLRRSRDLENAIIHWKTKRGPLHQYLQIVVSKKAAEKPAAPTAADSTSPTPSTPALKPRTGGGPVLRFGLGGLDLKKAEEFEPPYIVWLKSSTRPKFEWEVVFEDIKLGPVIGRGGCGTVYKGSFHGRTVAIKMLLRELLRSEDVLEGFVKEIEMMFKLRHKNILEFLGASVEYPNICFMTAFMDRGSVNDVIKTPECTWPLKIKMAKGAAEGLRFLHTRNPPIVHRDVKTFNLLVDNDYNVALGDFGVSDSLETEDKRVATRWGTVNWMAPEVFDAGVYDCASDIFSFGMVLWEMLTAQIPFGDDTNPLLVHQLIDSGERPFIPGGTHPEYAKLIRDCWETDPAKRPSLDEILQRLDRCL